MNSNDLKEILSTTNQEKSSINKTENIHNIMNMIDLEKNTALTINNWSKFPNSKKKKILKQFINDQTKQYNLSTEESNNLDKLLMFELSNNKLNKKSDVIYDHKLHKIVDINILKKNENNSYVIEKKISHSKSNKSRTNIERIIKKF